MNESRISLIISIFTFLLLVASNIVQHWGFLFPSSETRAAITYLNWSIDSGRLGTGPRATSRISFSNKGNQPITITGIRTSFALGSIESSDEQIDCDSEAYTWAHIPWRTFLDGAQDVQAIAITVTPEVPVTQVVFFEPAAVLDSNDREGREEFRIFACMDFDTRDEELKEQEVRVPLGWVHFTDDRITDFVRVPSFRSSFMIHQ